jgi:hypothetical protein
MDLEKRYSIDEQRISHNDFGDEIVIIHFETGNYYSLRGSAATLWKGLCQGSASARTLHSAFADPPAEAAGQIAGFLDDLHARGVIVETPARSAEAASSNNGKATFSAPEFEAFEDLQALLVADVIHDTDERGWPHMAGDDAPEPPGLTTRDDRAGGPND